MCRVSETSCRNASCPANELAACRVTPCTCDVSFVSEEGEEVDCHKADAVEAADGPEGRGGDVDVAEGSGSGGTNPTDEPSAGDGGDGGASERGRLEGETEKNKTTGDDAEGKSSGDSAILDYQELRIINPLDPDYLELRVIGTH